MVDELIKIYDENNNYSNENLMKSVAHKNGLWHRAVHICIYNSSGEILLQKRASCKELFPDMWDISVAGHVGVDDTELGAAVREISEEIGVEVKESDLDFYKIFKVNGRYKEILNNEFYYLYFLKLDLDLSDLKLQVEEVSDVQFVSIENVLDNSIGNLVPQVYWSELVEKVKNI